MGLDDLEDVNDLWTLSSSNRQAVIDFKTASNSRDTGEILTKLYCSSRRKLRLSDLTLDAEAFYQGAGWLQALTSGANQ